MCRQTYPILLKIKVNILENKMSWKAKISTEIHFESVRIVANFFKRPNLVGFIALNLCIGIDGRLAEK